MYSQEIVEISKINTCSLTVAKKPDIAEKAKLLQEATSFLDTIRDDVMMVHRKYCVSNHIHEVPTCLACGNHTWFRADNAAKGFTEYCSDACRKTVLKLPKDVHDKLSDRNWLFDMRINKRMSHQSIGDMFGVSDHCVAYWCTKLDIPKTQYNASVPESKSYLEDYDWMWQKYKVENLNMEKIADIVGVHKSTVDYAMGKLNIPSNAPNAYDRPYVKQSKGELELLGFIKEIYTGEIQTGKRTILGGRELDIYIPELKIAFEYNGVWSHSEKDGDVSYAIRKDKTYHISKTELCEEQGIELIQIWSSSWRDKKDIWKSRIRAKFGLVGRKLFARKCVVKEISVGEKNTFLDFNHLQGRDKSNTKLGMFYGDELVSVMTFSKSRYNKNADWELSRFATVKDTLVVGAFSKMVKHFRKLHAGSIISYADRLHSTGGVYRANGFEVWKVNPPSYHYFKDNENLLHRMNFQKKMITFAGDTRTEFEVMRENGYNWVWDCGTIAFILR